MKKYFLLISKSKFFLITLFLVVAFSFSIFINSANAAETGVYRIDKSSSGGGRVDNISIGSSALNFGATEGTVTLDGVVATLTGWGASSIGVAVPSQVEGVADVVVTTAEGAQLNIGTFTVNPKITSLSPSPAYVSQKVTIYGEGFRELVDCSGILTGDGNKIDVLSWSDTKLVVNLIKNKPLEVGQHQLIVKSCGDSSPFPILVKQAVCDTEKDWACTPWGPCSINGVKTRTCTQEYACDSIGTPPELSQTCTPSCTKDLWTCGDWSICSIGGTQTRTCDKVSECAIVDTPSPATSQSCAPPCYSDTWSCENWTTCSSNGSQTRFCNKTNDCATANTPSPVTSQSCTPPTPTCFEDIWSCGDWGSCSSQGMQTRSCNRTYDCPSAETSAPATSRSCVASETSSQGSNQGENTNREQILRATVKLECPTPDGKFYSQGSGTVIDDSGSILTNKHVITGTIGTCRVGFITNEDDIPSFTQIADVKRINTDASANGDMALLKIRNSKGQRFTAIDIFQGDSSNLKSGDTILPFGYPDENIYGQTITFTDGSYSGKGTTMKVPVPCDNPTQHLTINIGGFFKTMAPIDHGNSGGGAYQKSTGYFMGIPTLGSSCNPNIPSKVNYILSIKTIKGWLSSIGSYNVNQNNYANLNNYLSSVIKIEEIDVHNLQPLDAPTPDAVVSNKLVDKSKGKNISEIKDILSDLNKQPHSVQIQKESTVTGSNKENTLKQNTSSTQNVSSTPEQQPQKVPLIKRFFLWLSNLFNKLATQ